MVTIKTFTLKVTFKNGETKTRKFLISKDEAMVTLNRLVWPGDEFTFEITETEGMEWNDLFKNDAV